MLQEQMVSARQGDETGARDAGGQLASCFEWNYGAVARMHGGPHI